MVTALTSVASISSACTTCGVADWTMTDGAGVGCTTTEGGGVGSTTTDGGGVGFTTTEGGGDGSTTTGGAGDGWTTICAPTTPASAKAVIPITAPNTRRRTFIMTLLFLA